jgi:hypothetical protein
MFRKIRKRSTKFAAVFAAMLAVVGVVTAAPALANAANPNPDTKAVETVHANGTVTVNLTGTWSWPGQSCEGRYGEGWAVDWWGLSSSPTPANPFSLTNADEVTAPGTTTTGQMISPAGSIQIKSTGQYFHVQSFYDGEDVNSPTTCTDTGSGPTAGSTGSWSATATYPSKADIPPEICVNMYDEHGSEGKPSGSPNDFSPINDNDNSIDTNNFNPASGMGYCAVPTVSKVPKPAIGLLKQICVVATANCSASLNSDWASSHEIPSGGTAVWRLTVTDTGNTKLSDITITDPLAPTCAQTLPGTLKPKGTDVVTCSTGHVTHGFTNVAKVTGAPPSGASVSATSSATVTVLKTFPTSQTITPNDEAFVGQEATGTVTFSLFPPNDPNCISTPAYTAKVAVNSSGAAVTSNSSFVSTVPGTWRWVVKYVGNDGHLNSACGREQFTINNNGTASAATVTASGNSALTTSQTLTPNDEAFIRQEATGNVTFSLFPPGDMTCSGAPAYTSTVPVNSSGTAETANYGVVATTPGTWRWLVTYTGSIGHRTDPCGMESFTIRNG